MKRTQLFIGGGFALAFVYGLATPGWSQTLRAQGYYDYVDLAVSLLSDQPTAIAGASTPLLVSVDNHGADTAYEVQVQSTNNQNFIPIRTHGCAQDPLAVPLCDLDDDVPPQGTGDYLLIGRIPADARGVATVAVSATSAGIETQPGNEIALIKLPIVAQADLRGDILRRDSHLSSGVPFSFSVVFSNAGPSDFSRVNILSTTQGLVVQQAQWRCKATGVALCPQVEGTGLPQFQEVILPAASSLTYDVTLVASSVQGDSINIDLQVVSDGDTADTNLNNNRVIVVAGEAMLTDSFE